MSEQFTPRPQGRWSRLRLTAHNKGVPLPAILITVAVVVVVFLAGRLVYELRQVVLLIVLAGFIALLLNPTVVAIQRRVVPRRGGAVAVIMVCAALAFAGLTIALGHPFVSTISSFSHQLPASVSQAEHGKGWIGQLAARYHLLAWMQENAPKLVVYAKALARPALSLGNGTVSIIISASTFFILVVLMLLEGPKMRTWLLGQMTPDRAAGVIRVAGDVNRNVTGYMLSNCATSIIAGITIFTTLFILGVPGALLWALWFALLDLIPTFGSALAGVPIILFAVSRSPVEGIVTLVVCLAFNLVESHALVPVIASRTTRINPLITVISVLIGVSIGVLISGPFGGLVGALLAIPSAGVIQIVVREIWQASAPPPWQLADATRADAENPPPGELFPVPPGERAKQAAQLGTDKAGERDELRSALQVNIETLEETCAALRERAARAELDLEHANSEIRRLRTQSFTRRHRSSQKAPANYRASGKAER
jgi:predicted PurR-regulated permease PerM